MKTGEATYRPSTENSYKKSNTNPSSLGRMSNRSTASNTKKLEGSQTDRGKEEDPKSD